MKASSEESLGAAHGLSRFLVAYAEIEEQARQGMMPGKRFPQSDEKEIPDDGWDYAYNVLTQALNDISCGESGLAKAIRGDLFQ